MEEILGIEDGGNVSICNTLTGCRNFWNHDASMDSIQHGLDNLWEMSYKGGVGGTRCWFGDTSHGMDAGGFKFSSMSMFPRNWTIAMAYRWFNNNTAGFNTEVPVSVEAMKDWNNSTGGPGKADYNFAVTPDVNFLMLRGLFLHHVDGLATNFTVRHLTGYHMDEHRGRTVPMAPEARKKDMSRHGDQFSNFNAGKIINILEGLGGLTYSVHDDSFTFADNLPLAWDWMEFRVPVIATASSNSTTWVTARTERLRTGAMATKTVTVENNPFTNLYVQPWGDDLTVASSMPNSHRMADSPPGHASWHFDSSKPNTNSNKQTVVLRLDESTPDPRRPTADPILNTCS